MERRSKKRMYIAIGILLGAGLILAIFFKIPYSQTNAEFNALTDRLMATTDHAQGTFGEADITGLPEPVQGYFRYCGYLDTPKMSYSEVVYRDVDFALGKDKPLIKIDYTQYNFVAKPNRMAYIDSAMYGIPFEGLDAYIDGAGSMKGVLAKLYPLFYQTGGAMDKSSLVTFLSESLLVPNVALQDYITWEAIDERHARAAIDYYGISASGIFTFNEKGEMASFVTDDREAAAMDGTSEKVRWSVECSKYQETGGIRKPTVFRAIWNYDDGDLVYFDGQGTITHFA
ncbi:MAG: DUF6544 family protein [Syntrophomonadaceae bacterium]